MQTAMEVVRLEKQKKESNKDLTFINQVLTDRMEEDDVDSIEVDGVKLEIKSERQFSIDKDKSTTQWDDPDGDFHKYLKETGNDDMIKTKASVHHQTRTSFLNKQMDDGKVLPDFIKVTLFSHVNYNKSEIERRALDDGKQQPETTPEG